MNKDTKQCDTSVYKSLCICLPEFGKIPIDRKNLGIIGVASSYTLSIGGAVTDYKMNEYLKTQKVSKGVRTLSRVKIIANFGILNYLSKKIEGKSNERALIETGIAIGIGSAMETKVAQVAIKTGVFLLTRIATGAATGAAVGSAFPIVGTIIGAVAGTLIAGVINDEIFENEDKALESAKAENEKIAKLEKSYLLKINAINDYLIKNNYKELRILNENEAENLCKEASNLQSDYFKTIELMLSYKDYLRSNQNSQPSSPLYPLNSSQNTFLPPNTINSHRVGTIHFRIQALDEYAKMPIADVKLQLQNINLGVEALSDSQGIASFEIKESEYLQSFKS